MKLDKQELQCAYRCAAGMLVALQKQRKEIPQWLRDHHRKLDVAIRALSADGHEFDGGSASLAHEQQIGAEQAAAILGCSDRQVRRIAADLGGQQVSRAWVFTLNEVQQYADERR